ncbi:MAG: 1-(5-phosphoribosyl)-5-[(5-phosphoribosylamino)methylideneamino]imidazole-4-carboxamide isomerase [Alistipes sp.]|nr:1-(5-phosphoribosyl)-5-[(5-phosphoribosylamino)methylideneamino]imidazole-4-carboxamide isomerase [Alistipes sp.]
MIEIIPAIDMIGGECVRLTQGDYDRQTTYYKDPLEVALRYEACGVRRLHLVDLDGAKASHPVNLKVLERITSHTRLQVQYGGGIKSAEALRSVFGSGATRAICGSVAVKCPDDFRAWVAEFGAEHMILGADTRDGRIAINGWMEAATMGVEELIASFEPQGLSQVICTDIAKDGMLSGPSIPLYVALQRRFPQIDITVSGGISAWSDIEELDRQGLRSVVVGKAIYEGRIGFDRLERYFNQNA